jgi:hypothetical protein
LGSTCSLAADNTVEIGYAQFAGSGTPAEVSIRSGGLRLELVDVGKEPGLRAYMVYYADGASSDSVVRVGWLDKAVPFWHGTQRLGILARAGRSASSSTVCYAK